MNFKSYTILDGSGAWLGQVVLVSNGMFSAVTDYGNFSFAWRAFGDGDFREFIANLEIDYFSRKMYLSNADLWTGKRGEKACERFAEMILPPLQMILRKELGDGTDWD